MYKTEDPQDDDSARLAKATRYESQGRSRRRLTLLRRAGYRILAPLGLGLIRLWWRSCRIVAVPGAGQLDAAIEKHGAIVPVYWHQHQLFAVKPLIEGCHPGLKPGFLISPSVDGEIGVHMVRSVGAQAIRGSSSHTGARALRDFYQAIVRDGVSPIITPDGPRGPRHEFKPGAILLSQLSGKPIVPIAYAASRAYLFRTWDRFVLPWPGTRVAIAIGAPRVVPKGLDAAGLERWQREMAAELHAQFERARAALADGAA
jgi:lysophospholipid acyltransferase (LPLAT)-like uncharacterized protein